MTVVENGTEVYVWLDVASLSYNVDKVIRLFLKSHPCL